MTKVVVQETVNEVLVHGVTQTVEVRDGVPNATALRGRRIATDAPTDLQVYAWDADASEWTPTSLAGLGTVPVTSGGTGLETVTAGDLLYADGADSIATLGKGTARQLLQMNAGATAPEWASDIDVQGTLDVTGAGTFDDALGVAGVLAVGGEAPTGGAHIEAHSVTGSTSPTPTVLRIRSRTNAGDWSNSLPWGALDFYSDDASSVGVRARIGAVMDSTAGNTAGLHFWAGAANEQILLATMARTGSGVGLVTFPQPVSMDGTLSVTGTSTFGGDVQGTTANGFLDLLGDSGASVGLRLTDAGLLALGDTANANMAVGLTINQGGNDNQLFAGKSSDVAHGLTSGLGVALETDDYYTIQKVDGARGGVRMIVACENGVADEVWQVLVAGGAAGTGKTTAANGMIDFLVTQHDGANALADIGADGNVFSVRARVGGSNVCRLLVDEDGDLYSVTAAQTFDSEDDVLALRAFQRVTAPDQVVRNRFDDFTRYYEDDLIRMGVLGAPVAEGGMWNLTQHTRLLTGATWQLHTRQSRIEEAFRHLLSNPGDNETALALLEA